MACATGGGRCTCSDGCACSYTCTPGCDVTCEGSGTTCSAAGVDIGGDMDVECADGAHCFFDGRGESNVRGTCAGLGTECTFDCRPGPGSETGNCEQINCAVGARCRIHCDDTTPCGFETCHSMLLACAGWITCGIGTCP
jgi:hypothetical protein